MTGSGPEGDREWVRTLGLFTIIIGELIGYTGSGILVGYGFVRFAGAPRWTIAVTGALALVLAFHQIYRMAKRNF